MAASRPLATETVRFASDNQKLLFERGPVPTLASGGFNAGKTRGCLLKLLWLMDKFPGYRVAVIRRRSTELWKTTVPTLMKLVHPSMYKRGGRFNKQDGELILNNGSSFVFIHLEKEEVIGMLKGLEINACLFDQAEEMEEGLYDVLDGRLNRWDQVLVDKKIVGEYESVHGRDTWPWKSKAGVILPPSYMLLTCNPDTELHWLYQRFHPKSPQWQTDWRMKGYLMINFDSRDNLFANEQNIKTLMEKGESYVNMYVKGVWGRPEGQLFYIDAKSILDPTPKLLHYIKTECSHHRILDHGFNAPTCCLWAAVDRDGNSFIYREYYLADDQISTHRRNITDMSKGEEYRTNLADPAIKQKQPSKAGGRFSVHEEYTDCNIYPRETAIWWSYADNNEMASRERLRSYLRKDPLHKHPVDGTMDSPRLYFVQKTEDYPHGCAHAINEVRAAKLEKLATVDGKAVFSDNRDESVPDHALDPIRYHVMSRPSVGVEDPRMMQNKSTMGGYAALARETSRLQKKMNNLHK